MHILSRISASAYISRFTSRSLSDVSYSDECQTKCTACNDSENTSVNNYCNLSKFLTSIQCNLQLLMIEIVKIMNNPNPTLIKDVFAENIAV